MNFRSVRGSSVKINNDKLIKPNRRFLFSIIYGLFFSLLPISLRKDFSNYLNYADHSWLIATRYLSEGVLVFFFNEPIWLLINIGLSLFLEQEAIVRAIVFFSSSATAWLVLRSYPKYFLLLLLFLLLPQVTKNYLVHVRQGLAISFFLWGWCATARSTRFLLFSLTPFIHSSFFFIMLFLVITYFFRYFKFSIDLKIIVYFLLAISVGVAVPSLAYLFGARQGGSFSFESSNTSGIGFLLWGVVLSIMLSTEKKWLREHIFAMSLIILYLTTYWMVEFAARVLESGLLVVFLAGLSLPGWRRQAFVGVVLSAGYLVWALRIYNSASWFT